RPRTGSAPPPAGTADSFPAQSGSPGRSTPRPGTASKATAGSAPSDRRRGQRGRRWPWGRGVGRQRIIRQRVLHCRWKAAGARPIVGSPSREPLAPPAPPIREMTMLRTLAIAVTLTLALPALAQDAPQMTPEQEAMMQAYIAAGTPGAPHAALASAVGEYDIAIRNWDAPGAEPTASTVTATRKMILGGRVLVEQMQSEMYGQPFTGHGIVGFDYVTEKWWPTWNDSMSTGVMLSEGDR